MSDEPHTFPILDEDHLSLVIAKAYELSQPQGMGHMHFVPGPIPEKTLKELIAGNKGRQIHLDYVHGRAVKLSIFVYRPEIGVTIDRPLGSYYVENRNSWFDHTEDQWLELKRVLSGDRT